MEVSQSERFDKWFERKIIKPLLINIRIFIIRLEISQATFVQYPIYTKFDI